MKQTSKGPAGLAKLRGSRRKTIQVTSDTLVATEPMYSDHTAPLVISPKHADLDAAAWLAKNQAQTAAWLQGRGALLLRGFNLTDESGFQAMVQAGFGGTPLDYTYRSTPRTAQGNGVYTSTEYPADQRIPLHNENAYARIWPRQIFFYSMICAERGGETPLADSRRIYQRLDPKLRARFEKWGVMYVRNYGDVDLPWREVFQCDSRDDVNAACAAMGIEAEWRGDRLRTRQVNPATVVHPESGEKVWFNQAHLFHASALPAQVREALDVAEEDLPRNTYFGDGSPIPADDLAEIHAAFKAEETAFPWQPGDLLALDNLLFAHGRNPFEGARKVVVTMRHAATYRDGHVAAYQTPATPLRSH